MSDVWKGLAKVRAQPLWSAVRRAVVNYLEAAEALGGSLSNAEVKCSSWFSLGMFSSQFLKIFFFQSQEDFEKSQTEDKKPTTFIVLPINLTYSLWRSSNHL